MCYTVKSAKVSEYDDIKQCARVVLVFGGHIDVLCLVRTASATPSAVHSHWIAAA